MLNQGTDQHPPVFHVSRWSGPGGEPQRRTFLQDAAGQRDPSGLAASSAGPPSACARWWLASDSSGSGANWRDGLLSDPTTGPTAALESRVAYEGTVAPTDLSRATDAREKGRIGITGSVLSYAGSYGRVTADSLGRDVNPLGRGDGQGYVAGALNVVAIAPRLPKNQAGSGTGNSVNNCGSSASVRFTDTASSPMRQSSPQPLYSGGVSGHIPGYRCSVHGHDAPMYWTGHLHLDDLPDYMRQRPVSISKSENISVGQISESSESRNSSGITARSTATVQGFSWYEEQWEPHRGERSDFIHGYERAVNCAEMLKGGFTNYGHGTRKYSTNLIQCILEKLKNATFQFGGCCGISAETASELGLLGPAGLIIAGVWGMFCCGNIIDQLTNRFTRAISCADGKILICKALFTFNLGEYNGDMPCQIAHVLIHEAVHKCLLSTVGFELSNVMTVYGAGKNPADTIAYDMLTCCGCDPSPSQFFDRPDGPPIPIYPSLTPIPLPGLPYYPPFWS